MFSFRNQYFISCFFLKTSLLLVFWHLLYVLNKEWPSELFYGCILWNSHFEIDMVFVTRSWWDLAEKDNVGLGRPSFKTRGYWELAGCVWDFENSDRVLSTLTAVRSSNQKSEIQECRQDRRYGEETRYQRGEREMRQKWLQALCLPKLAELFCLC